MVILPPSHRMSTILKAWKLPSVPTATHSNDHLRRQLRYEDDKRAYDEAAARHRDYHAQLTTYTTRLASYTSDIAAWRIADRRALAILLATIPSSLKRELSPTSSSHLWQLLVDLFDRQDIATLYALIKDFGSITMDSTAGAAAFTRRVLDLARRLAALGALFSSPTPGSFLSWFHVVRGATFRFSTLYPALPACPGRYIWRNDMPEPKLLSPTGPSPQPAILPNLSFSPTCHSPQPVILPNLPFSPTCHSPQPVILPNLPFSPTCHSPQPVILPNLPFSPTCHSPQPAILPNLPILPCRLCSPHSPTSSIPPRQRPPLHTPSPPPPLHPPSPPSLSTPPLHPPLSTPPLHPPLSTPPLHPPSPPPLSTPPLHPPSPPPLSNPPSPTPLSNPPLQTTLQANQATLSFLASLLHVNSSCASLPASSRPSLTWTRPSNAPPSPRRRKRFDKTEGTGLFAREERETAERETAEAQTGEGGVGGSEGDGLTNQEQPPHPWGCIPELPAVDWPKLRWRFDWSTFTIHATSDRKPLAVRAW
ncbi:unnamed protein product [Closterium sp. NIES-64]|nr:unnamed protein product [Closterium sp. NIES-64]